MTRQIELLEARQVRSASASVLVADLAAVRGADAETAVDLAAFTKAIASDAASVKAAAPRGIAADHQVLNELGNVARAARLHEKHSVGAFLAAGSRAESRFAADLEKVDARPARAAAQERLTAALNALQAVFSDQAVTTLDSDATALVASVAAAATAVGDALPAASDAASALNAGLPTVASALSTQVTVAQSAVTTLATDEEPTPTSTPAPTPTAPTPTPVATPTPAPTPTPSGSSAYIATDTVHYGNWLDSSYGSAGQFIAGLSGNLPAYAKVSTTAGSLHVFKGQQDVNSLQTPDGGTIAAEYIDAAGFDVSVKLTDGKTHQIALYLAEFDNPGRTESIQAFDDANTALGPAITVSNFSLGQYVLFDVSGSVTYHFAGISGGSPVFSALLLADAASVSLDGTLDVGYFPLQTPTGTVEDIVGPDHIVPSSGTGTAGDLGAVTVTGDVGYYDSGFSQGNLTLTAVNASPAGSDTLNLHFVSTTTVVVPPTATYYIVGGTGKYADATGIGTIDFTEDDNQNEFIVLQQGADPT